MSINVSELSLYKGSAIKLDDVGMVHPFTVGDIEFIGEENYELYLKFLTIDKSLLQKALQIDDENFTVFDFIANNCIRDAEFLEIIVNALEYIFKEEVFFHKEGLFFIGDIEDGKTLNFQNYEDFKSIVRIQNCLEKKADDDEMNPANAKTAAILKKRKEAREKLKKAKSNESEPFTWGDLVSILCANGNGITMDNVWSLSVYAFNKQFARMKMLEDYDISVRSLLAGAKEEDVEFVHWMSKIE